MIGGSLSDHFAFAFAGGYQAALRHLVSSLSNEHVASLAITEEGGGHPKAINATLIPKEKGGENAYILSGHKKWITLGSEATTLLVAASMGKTPEGLNQIRVVQVPSDAAGILIKPMTKVPFVPEISHGEVYFERVEVPSDSILSGDGYINYIRPFRTIEDIFLSAGFLGFIFRIATCYQWPLDTLEELTSLTASLHAIMAEDLNAAETHIALDGFLVQERGLIAQIDPLWEKIPGEIRERWNRDRPLLQVAGKLRGIRLEAAWKKVHEVPVR
ncbi:MAG: hypothetical protein RBG13Loki_2242 [Promethearchaeota archaeon CR_4]|nr:MAG: hypothetical protein RBG13Loki_2242 [Candidatus Lokiarchaeota archaeon CR_4]